MSTLTRLEENVDLILCQWEPGRGNVQVLAQFIDAHISIAINKPVPVYVQNVCPCVFREGKFQTLCAMHQDLVNDAFKLGARSSS